MNQAAGQDLRAQFRLCPGAPPAEGFHNDGSSSPPAGWVALAPENESQAFLRLWRGMLTHEEDGAAVFRHARKLGFEASYRSG
jgi:hypothetical protein